MGVTEATLGALDVHVTTRPGPMLLPLASASVAVSTRPSFLWIAGGFDGEMATEATGACVEWALGHPDVHTVQATTFPWHRASLGVIRKLGMVQVGVRQHDILGDLLVFERRR